MSSETGSCPINIGAAGVAQRRTMGIAMLAVAIGAGAAMVSFGIDRPWRAALAVPFFLAGLGIFQARAKTWVVLASRGSRDLGGGVEPVADAAEDALLRSQARNVLVRSLLLGFSGAALAIAL